MKIKTWFARFEGDPEKDGLPKFRVIGTTKLKPVNHSDEIVEFVKLSDVKPLVEASEAFRKEPTNTFKDESLKVRLSYWKDIMLGLNDRDL